MGHFIEVASGKIGPNKNLVISKLSDGSFTVSQQIDVNDSGKTLKVFLKGSIKLSSVMDLYSLYEVVKEALIQEQIIEKDNRILGLDPIRFNEMVDYWNMMNPEHKIEKI
jgi:hypothetical protein